MDVQIEIQEHGESSQPRQRAELYSIFRAPEHIRHGRRSGFEPKFVTIGPYHHYNRENYDHEAMRDLRFRFASEILNVPQKYDDIMDAIPVEPFMEIGKGALHSYNFVDGFPYNNDYEFVRKLVLDSFFIIQIMCSFSQNIEEFVRSLYVSIAEIRTDLLLLENQIPLFFVEKVYTWLKSQPRTSSKYEYEFGIIVAQFLFSDMSWEYDIDESKVSSAAHLLDLYWQCSSSTKTIESQSSTQKKEQPATWADLDFSKFHDIPNATELHQTAGITFETLEDQFSRKERQTRPSSIVTFSNGVMKMPSLKIHPHQEKLLVNLIAYEHSMSLHLRFFSCYIKLMDSLIDSKKDVELLQQCGVIRNTLSSHEVAATFFNDIGNFCVVDHKNHIFSSLYEDVRKYYNSKWNRRWAKLRHDYFNSPWAGISVAAGSLLLLLTILQTFFTVYAYFRPRGS